MVLSQILFRSIHFKVILCPNVLRSYVNISPTPGGAASLIFGEDVLLIKVVLIVLYFPWGGYLEKRREDSFSLGGAVTLIKAMLFC